MRRESSATPRRIAEQHPDWPSLTVGGYSVGPCVHGGWWIENEDGEGMQVQTAALVNMFDDFWAKNF